MEKEKELGIIFLPKEELKNTINLDRNLNSPYCQKVKENLKKFSLAISYSLIDEDQLELGPLYCVEDNNVLNPLIVETKSVSIPEELKKTVPGLLSRIEARNIGCALIKCGKEKDEIKKLIKKVFDVDVCRDVCRREHELKEVKETGDVEESNRENGLVLDEVDSETDIFGKENKECEECSDLIKLLLKHKRQIILQGPPGTGKTFLAREIAKQLIRKNEGICEQKAKELILEESAEDFRRIKEIIEKEKIKSLSELGEYINEKTVQIKESRDENVEDLVKEKDEAHRFLEKWEEKKKECLSKSVRFVQFHSSYTYEDFVRGIVMTLDEKTKMPQFKAVDKIFAEICKEAEANKDERFVLIIDEINRANLSMVLGELIYALEYRGEEVETPYEVDGSKVLRVPENLFIIGTMNTADRSAGNIDYAIRRRFAFYSVLPDKDKINNLKGRKLYEDIVERIFDKNGNCVTPEFKNSVEDIKVGHTYFRTENENDVEELAYNFVYQVIPLLKEYIKDGILVGEEVDDVFKDVFGKVLSSVNIEDVLDKLVSFDIE